MDLEKNMSTSLAILELVEEITNNAIDDCKSTVGVFIDLKKAFDTVDHNILIKKTRGWANKWVSSYLANRIQYMFVLIILMIPILNAWIYNVACHKGPYWGQHCLYYMSMTYMYPQ